MALGRFFGFGRSALLLVLLGGVLVVELVARGVAAEGGVLWPTRAARIEAELESDDLTRRRAAAARLGHLSPSLAERGVLLALGDPDREVRLAGARAAHALGVTSAAREVESWLGDPDAALRIAALCVLRLALDDASLGDVTALLSDAEPLVRVEAARTLGQARESLAPRAALGLEGSLSDTTVEVRLESVRALGGLARSSSALGVVQRLRDEDDEVRSAAAVALGALGSDAAVGPLLLAIGDRSASVRIAALTSLGQLGQVAASTTLDERIIRLVRESESAAERRAAARTLLALGAPAALDAVVRLLADETIGSGLVTSIGEERRRNPGRSLAIEDALGRCLARAAGNDLGRCADALGEFPRFFDFALAPAVKRRIAPERLLRIARAAGRHHPELTLLALEQLDPEGDRLLEAARVEAATLYLASVPELPTGAVEPLVRAFGAEGLMPEARGAVLGLTGRTKPGPDLGLVRRALASTAPAVVEGAVLALVAHAPTPGEVAQLVGSPDPLVRRAALRGAHQAPRLDVVRLAIDRLELGGGVARSPLTELLFVEVDGLTKGDEARILGLLRGTTGGLRDRLLERLVRPGVDGSAARAAYERGGSDDRMTLVSFAAEPHGGVVGSSQAFRREIGVLAAKDSDPRVRALAPRLLDPSRDQALLAEMTDSKRGAAERTAALLWLGERASVDPCRLLGERQLGLAAAAFELLRPEQACDGVTLADFVRLDRTPALRELAAHSLRRLEPSAPALRSCATYEVTPDVARACSGEIPELSGGEGAMLLTDPLGGAPLARVRVALLDSSGRLVTTVTDRAGRFSGPAYASLLDPRLAY